MNLHQQELEKLIESLCSLDSKLQLEILKKDAKNLSDLFTKNREGCFENYLEDEGVKLAYLAHFTLTNFAKSLHCLEQIHCKDGSWIKTFQDDKKGDRSQIETLNDDSLKILDLGAGTGAATLAASSFFRDMSVIFFAIDQSGAALNVLKNLFGKTKDKKHTLNSFVSNINEKSLKKLFSKEKFDIIIAANFFNEADKDKASTLCEFVIKNFLNDTGKFIIIDPALKTAGRRIMELRNYILEKKLARIVAPCLHRESCPMLSSNDRDWCHFYIEWNRPKLIEKMDALVGTDHKYLKMTYLIFQKTPAPTCEKNLHRVVSSPLKSKGKLELILCGFDGQLRRIRRLDRNASEENSELGQVKRGDIVSLKDVVSISSDTQITLVDRFN